MKKYLEAGRLTSVRGLKGELRFECWCDSPGFLENVVRYYMDPNGEKPLEVLLYRTGITSIIFKGYEDRTSAAALAGRVIWFDRDDVELPEDVCYNIDLIGLDVTDINTGAVIGRLEEITAGARYDYLIISGEKTYRVPDVGEYVIKKSPDTGITVKLVDGLET